MSKKIIEAQMHALAYGGSCIGGVTSGPERLLNKKVFVRDCIPGEKVQARVSEDKKRFILADFVETLEASPDRVAPPCKYFGKCGGCDLQHMTIAAQRKYKLDLLETTLSKQAGIETKVSLASEELPEYGYRNRISLKLDKVGKFGFFGRQSNSLVAINRCELANTDINDFLETCKLEISACGKDISGIEITCNESNEILLNLKARKYFANNFSENEPWLKALEEVSSSLEITHKGQVLYSSTNAPKVAGHFQQVNNRGNLCLQKITSGYFQNEEVFEFYAGAGNFSFTLVENGNSVVAVERDPVLVAAAKDKCEALDLSSKMKFHECSTEDFLERTSEMSNVLLDPPRTGAMELVQSLDPQNTKKIVYVSCNLATFTRDVKILVEKGFRLEGITLVDMFPQTHHMELVARLA